MDHPLIDKIVREGIDSVNVTMLSPAVKLRLLTEAGDRLLRADRIGQAASAYALANNRIRLRETGAWFLEQKRYAAAALFLRHAPEGHELADLAAQCARVGEMKAAAQLYRDLGDAEMAEFLEVNFGETQTQSL